MINFYFCIFIQIYLFKFYYSSIIFNSFIFLIIYIYIIYIINDNNDKIRGNLRLFI